MLGKIPEIINSDKITYGVDWSERADTTGHCWFPCTSRKHYYLQKCAYSCCTLFKSKLHWSMVECGICGLVVHSSHLNNLAVLPEKTLPCCRPSFIDETVQQYNCHFWSRLSVLSKPCECCEQKSIPRSVRTISDDAHGIICLWCSKNYHQSCWEQFSGGHENNHCNYGIMRNIIVRPQWLRRCNSSLNGFRAEFVSNSFKTYPKHRQFPYTPTLFFVSMYSSGQNGYQIYRKLIRQLNPRQVFVLDSDKTIRNALDIYSSLPNIRICVCGGDHAVTKTLSSLAEIYLQKANPPVSVYPLETINNFARLLGWDEQYYRKNCLSLLPKIYRATLVPMDCWQVHIQQSTIIEAINDKSVNVADIPNTSCQNQWTLPKIYFFNYISIGLDSIISMDRCKQFVHKPVSFASSWKSQFKNINPFILSKKQTLKARIILTCDGKDLTDTLQNPHTLVILNTPAYIKDIGLRRQSFSMKSMMSHSEQGRIFETRFDLFNQNTRTSNGSIESFMNELITINDQKETGTIISDEKIEVFGLNAKHTPMVHKNYGIQRITQCNRIHMEITSPITILIDGEPFCLPSAATIDIDHGGQMLVLENRNS